MLPIKKGCDFRRVKIHHIIIPGIGDERHPSGVIRMSYIMFDHIGESVDFFSDHRGAEVADCGEEESDAEEGENDRDDSSSQMENSFEEFYDRIKQISDEAGCEEGEKYI